MKKLCTAVAGIALAACQAEDIQQQSSSHSAQSSVAFSSSIQSQPSQSSSTMGADSSNTQSSSSVSGVDSLNGSWVLMSVIADTGVARSALNLFSVEFDGQGRVSLGHECYQSSGDYHLIESSRSLTIGSMPMTRNTCSDPLWDGFFEVLQTSASFHLGEDALTLISDDGRSLVFRRQFKLCDTPILINDDVLHSSMDYRRESVKVSFAGGDAMTDLLNTFEHEYGDWVVAESDNCSDLVKVTVHTDTLARLRCDVRIESLSY